MTDLTETRHIEKVNDIDPTLKPFGQKAQTMPKGRLADRVACGLACLSGFLAFLTATLFFAGFAGNDTNPAGLASAFILSFGLGLFAIVPSLIVAKISYRAWRYGFDVKRGLYVLFLSLPWVVLSILIILYTPLPFYLGIIAFTLSSLICVWTCVSLSLLSKNKRS